jgi:O-antigen/teichoic acid export membrane protein
MMPRLLRDLIRYAPGQIVPIVVATLSTAIFTRLVLPHEYGTFVLVLAVVTTVSSPFGQWLMQGVLRYYPAYARDGREADLVRAISMLALFFGAIVTLLVVALLAVGLGGANLRPLDLLPAGLMTFFGVANAGQQAALMARFESWRYSVLNMLSAVCELVLPLLLFPVLGAVPSLLWGSAVAAFGLWMIVAIQQHRIAAGARVRLGDLGRISREAIMFGMPLAVSEIGVQTLAYSDRYAIALFIGAGAVGLYSTNYSIAEKLLVLVQAPLIYAAHSQIMSHWELDHHSDAERLIRSATRWLLILGVPLVALTFVRSEMISAALLGEAFVAGHTVLPLVALSILVYAASQYGHKSFELARDTWVIAASLLAAAGANVLAAVVLINRLGYVGGALATLLGYGAYAGFTYVVSRRRGPFSWHIPWPTVARTTLGAGAAAGIWALIMPERLSSVWSTAGVGASGLLGLAVYGLVLGVSGELSWGLTRRTIAGSFSAMFRRHSDAH